METEDDGALKDFTEGYMDGWHGRPKKSKRTAIYTRAYANAKKHRVEWDLMEERYTEYLKTSTPS